MAEEDFDKLVGSNVQKYRTARGMSQADLAAAISTPGEHVHQQTIQKIEKGTRPLKFSEAEKIARALTVNPLHLTDGETNVEANASFIERSAALGKLQTELQEFARRLAPLLVDLADLVALQRTDEECRPDPYLLEIAQSWLGANWGKTLNVQLLDAIREHPRLADISPEFDAPTYGEVLTRLTEQDLSRWQVGDPAPEDRDDVSET